MTPEGEKNELQQQRYRVLDRSIRQTEMSAQQLAGVEKVVLLILVTLSHHMFRLD